VKGAKNKKCSINGDTANCGNTNSAGIMSDTSETMFHNPNKINDIGKNSDISGDSNKTRDNGKPLGSIFHASDDKTHERQTVLFKRAPRIVGRYSVVGPKEGRGAFSKYFDKILAEDLFKQKSYEKAERLILAMAVENAIKKANLVPSDIDMLLSGDLLNQITSSSFAAAKFDTTYLGLFGACSTMTESLAIGAVLIDGGYLSNVACATGSHFSTVERQFRYPLELGTQRPPTSQWTVTGAGCSVLSAKGNGAKITSATFGKVVDYGITDANNMGAAMAPAAMATIEAHFNDMHAMPDDYDLIVTGDLGKLGSEILIDLLEHRGIKLGNNYCDCGQMIYTKDQKVFQGGSGPACSAVVLNSYILDRLEKHDLNKVLFVATGALLSPTSAQQGDTIPCIAHAIVVERGK